MVLETNGTGSGRPTQGYGIELRELELRTMNSPLPETPEVQAKIYRLFRAYFDKAEKKRRWSIRDDIPWNQCNPGLDPAIADVLETFCAVELYLPDYLSKLIPQVRAHRG